MTDPVIASLITALGGAVIATITGVLGFRSARWAVRRELEVELRQQRLAAFRQLWALSEPLAKYGRTGPAGDLTRLSIEVLSGELRHWYFAQGGMFLSDPSRNAYFEFQDALQDTINDGNEPAVQLDEETRESLRRKASSLRTTLRTAFKGFPQM